MDNGNFPSRAGLLTAFTLAQLISLPQRLKRQFFIATFGNRRLSFKTGQLAAGSARQAKAPFTAM